MERRPRITLVAGALVGLMLLSACGDGVPADPQAVATGAARTSDRGPGRAPLVGVASLIGLPHALVAKAQAASVAPADAVVAQATSAAVPADLSGLAATPAAAAPAATPVPAPEPAVEPALAPQPAPAPEPEPVPAPAPTGGSAEDAIAAYFGDVYDSAVGVAWCESKMDPSAVSPGGGNWGLFQINTVHVNSFEAVTGVAFYDGVLDPYLNSQFARYLYDGQGWGPWACRWAA